MTKKNKLNDYSGSEWARASLSVFHFNGEMPVKRRVHGAAFPFSLAKHVILTYSKSGDTVLDPFVGVGTTTDAAMLLGRKGIGTDINEKFITLAKKGPDDIDKKKVTNIDQFILVDNGIYEKKELTKPILITDDASAMLKYVKLESVDLILTSPPYGNLLRLIRPKFADKMKFTDRDTMTKMDKTVDNPRVYSDLNDDLGNMPYPSYLTKIKKIFGLLYKVAKPDAYNVWVVKDYRDIKNGVPYVNLHSDLIKVAREKGWILMDILIWDQSDRRPLVVLGYPSRNFYSNIGHSYILIFKK